MPEPLSFVELIRRVRAGDQDAATELVQRYEPSVRRAVRLRLGDTRLASLFDSMDVCQSVLASFFVRAASGDFDLDTPDHLMKLLTAMARNKLATQVRRQRAQRRDYQRTTSGALGEDQVAAAVSTPSRQVAAAEILAEVQRRLTADERQLVELRQQGMEWAAVAEQVGGSAEAVRKRLTRALDRVSQELGLDGDAP